MDILPVSAQPAPCCLFITTIRAEAQNRCISVANPKMAFGTSSFSPTPARATPRFVRRLLALPK